MGFIFILQGSCCLEKEIANCIIYSFPRYQFQQLLFFCPQIAFDVLLKALISLEPGEEMELLRKHFQEFISGFMSLPINLPGTKLYQSLQASLFNRGCFLLTYILCIYACPDSNDFIFGCRQKRKW